MDWHQWMILLQQELAQTTPVEWVAVALGVAEVLLARVNNDWLYPTGIIGTVLAMVLLWRQELYADFTLNAYYVVMSFYGWYHWLKKTNKPEVKISWSNQQEWLYTLFITVGGTAFAYFLLTRYTHSTVPFMDSWVSATGWAGMWLLARRKIENWALLNLSNIFAIPLLFYKHLPMFALLTIFLFIIGTWGFFDWVKIYRHENRKPETA